MQTVTDTFLAALRYGHAIKTVATAFPPTGDPVDLPVEDGTITIDRTAAHRRQLALTVPPVYPSGHALEGQEVYPSTSTNPIAPYGTEIVVSTGIRLASEALELVQQGIYRIEDVSRDLPGGAVTINGWDRSRQILDQRFLAPRKFAAQLGTDLIQLLITEVYPTATFNITTTDTTTIPKHVVDRDRWPEVQRVATVIGCEVFPDPMGVWVIQDVPNLATAESVWQVDAGAAGVLISATDSVSREGAPNVIVTLGESFNGRNGPVTITHASPAHVNYTNHEVVNNQQVSFHSSGTLPAPLTQGTTYWVQSIVDSNTITISATRSGGAINTTTDGSGTHNMEIQGIPITGQARDTDPLSPTSTLGAYGLVARFYSSPHIKTQSQANRVAANQLSNHIGATRFVTWNAVPNPALDAGDCITIVRPNGTTEKHIIDSLSIPLSPSGEMTGDTRAADWAAE